MKNIKNQSGSAYVAVIIILVLALIGALGFAFWENFTQSNVTNDDENKVSSSIDSEAAAILVGNFYAEYSAVSSNQTITSATVRATFADRVINKYGNDNFLAYMDQSTGADNAICLQQYFRGQVVADYKTVDDSAIITVHEDATLYNSDGSIKVAKDPIEISVKVVDEDGLKIDSITCPVN